MKTTFLANFFDRIREIVEAAETPFSKLAVFVLPILSPIVPASFTGMHVFKLLEDIFDFDPSISVTLATIIGLVLEILGYVGAIEFIGSVFRWLKNQTQDGYLVPMVITGLAYLFYLVAMFFINVQLGIYFNTPSIINNVIGLLSFITVPTGLLAANHLGQKAEDEQSYVIRQEKREDRLKSKAIKAGINPYSLPSSVNNQTLNLDVSQPQVKQKFASDYKDHAWEMLSEQYAKDGTILSPSQLTERINKKYKINLEHGKVKGFWTRTTQDWKANFHI
jgi:hypothetical protein